MIIKNLSLFFLGLSIFLSCNTPVVIYEWYRIYSEDEYGNGYYLMCKMGTKDSPFIENIHSVAWNTKYIIIEQNNVEQNIWYIVKAKGEVLMCGQDTLMGPLSKTEKEHYLKENNIQKLQKRKFKS